MSLPESTAVAGSEASVVASVSVNAPPAAGQGVAPAARAIATTAAQTRIPNESVHRPPA